MHPLANQNARSARKGRGKKKGRREVRVGVVMSQEETTNRALWCRSVVGQKYSVSITATVH